MECIEEIKEKYKIQDSEYLSIMSSLNKVNEQMGFDPQTYKINIFYNKIEPEYEHCDPDEDVSDIFSKLNITMQSFSFNSKIKKCICDSCRDNNTNNCRYKKFYNGEITAMCYHTFSALIENDISDLFRVQNEFQVIDNGKIFTLFCGCDNILVQKVKA